MDTDTQRGCRFRGWLRTQGFWFWPLTVATAAVAALWGGSQIAHDTGQSVDWYTGFGQWLGGLGSLIAAGVALLIATRDRRDRIAERRNEESTHARLVRLTARSNRGSPTVTVTVSNFGSLPILDVELVAAAWADHPKARWGTNGITRENLFYPLLMPQTTDKPADSFTREIRYHVWFMHPTEGKPLVEPILRSGGAPEYEQIDVSKVVLRVRFTTANGVRWETPTSGAHSGQPLRLSSA